MFEVLRDSKRVRRVHGLLRRNDHTEVYWHAWDCFYEAHIMTHEQGYDISVVIYRGEEKLFCCEGLVLDEASTNIFQISLLRPRNELFNLGEISN